MWEVGGIKIESTWGRIIFFRAYTENGKKGIFLWNAPYSKIFRGECLQNPYALMNHDSENVLGLGDRASFRIRIRIRIPWVLAPKTFPVENFWVQSVSPLWPLWKLEIFGPELAPLAETLS